MRDYDARACSLVLFVCFIIVRGEPPLQQHQPLQSLQPLQPPPSGYENGNFNPNVGVTNYGQNLGPEENQVNYPNFQQQPQISEQSTGPEVEVHRPRGHKSFENTEDIPTGEEDDLNSEAIPGQPEQDYPVFDDIPKTSFTCSDKTFPGYFADIEARCQVFHICEVGGAKHSFLCPSGSVFNQKYLVCDWWYDFVCENVQDLFSDQQELERLAQEKEFPSPVTATGGGGGGGGGTPVSNPGIQQDNQYQQPNQQPGFTPSGQGQNGNNFGFPDEQFNFQGNNNAYFPPNDIFHGAETGVPNRNRNYENENQGNEYSNNRGPENGNNNNNNDKHDNNNNKQNEQQFQQPNDSKTRANSEIRPSVNENSTIYNTPKKDNNVSPDARHRQNVRINRRGNQFSTQIKPTEQTFKEKPSENSGQLSNLNQTRAPDGNSGRFSTNQYISSTPETLINRESAPELNKNNAEINVNQGFSGPVFNNPNYQTPIPLQ